MGKNVSILRQSPSRTTANKKPAAALTEYFDWFIQIANILIKFGFSGSCERDKEIGPIIAVDDEAI